MTRPILVPPVDGAGLLGVRFRPGMATAFLHLSAAALTDDRASLEAVWRDGRIDASRLAASLGVTRQHLARRFAAHVGVTPKTFCRVVRLWTVLRSIAAAK
jgi:AraC-like DNA-binding protein